VQGYRSHDIPDYRCYRAALEAFDDITGPGVLAKWISEIQSRRDAAEARLH
jgi:hypothetical protein